jgi:hypothetical protein
MTPAELEPERSSQTRRRLARGAKVAAAAACASRGARPQPAQEKNGDHRLPPGFAMIVQDGDGFVTRATQPRDRVAWTWGQLQLGIRLVF